MIEDPRQYLADRGWSADELRQMTDAEAAWLAAEEQASTGSDLTQRVADQRIDEVQREIADLEGRPE